MYKRLRYILMFFIMGLACATISCSRGEMDNKKADIFKKLEDVPETSWEKLSKKKFYFGHQSVGLNIVDGMNALIEEYPQINLKIVESTDLASFEQGVFAHSRIGENRRPESKINELIRFAEERLGKNADVAAIKFCYVDIRADSQITEIIKKYSESVNMIKEVFPDMTIIHFTVPLMTKKTNWKTFIKKIIGKSTRQDDNIIRNEYNRLLLNKYDKDEPVFDIARIESTYPDGRRCSFSKGDKIYYSLVPEYTDDGGHLNCKGRKIVAEQFLIFLSNLTK